MKVKIVMSLIGLSFLIAACGTSADTLTKADTTMEENNGDLANEKAESDNEETEGSEIKETESAKEGESEENSESQEENSESQEENSESEETDMMEENGSETESEEESKLTAAELEEVLLQQPCYVEKVEFIKNEVTSEGDICLVVKNNSGTDIKNVFYAMAGWDSNNLPLILDTYKRDNGTGYVIENDFGDANMIDGGTFGEDLLFGIKEKTAYRLETVKAVVIKYVDFDGNTWENPYYSDWIELYKEKKLEQ